MGWARGSEKCGSVRDHEQHIVMEFWQKVHEMLYLRSEWCLASFSSQSQGIYSSLTLSVSWIIILTTSIPRSLVQNHSPRSHYHAVHHAWCANT